MKPALTAVGRDIESAGGGAVMDKDRSGETVVDSVVVNCGSAGQIGKTQTAFAARERNKFLVCADGPGKAVCVLPI